jgi:hypothetical protein
LLAQVSTDNVAMDLLTLIVLFVVSFALAVVGTRSVLGLVLHLMGQAENPVPASGHGSPS